ncbi:hypothetical protein [Paraburkholderia nemoris]|nr:hypothetical protein [Paraburkholderia nemoris]
MKEDEKYSRARRACEEIRADNYRFAVIVFVPVRARVSTFDNS